MMNHFLRLLSFVYILTASSLVWSASPKLATDTDVATAGYYRLDWSAEPATDFILEESQQSSFEPARVLYEGPDTARIISGRKDGDYYYRVRDVNNQDEQSAWSDVVHVKVQHHPLSRAFVFFAIGAIVFIATLSAIIIGNRNASQH